MLLPREQVIDIGFELSVDESKRTHCPFCDNQERSFVVTRDLYQLKYICHRATCSAKGIIPLTNNTQAPVTKTMNVSDKRAAFIKNLQPIPTAVIADLDHRYGIDYVAQLAANWRWAPDEDDKKGRLYMPIKSSTERVIGSVLRSLHKGVVPKTRMYLEDPGEPLLAFYMNHHGDALPAAVIVEDQISALKVSKIAKVGAALLGCNFDEYKARRIQSKCFAQKLTPVLWLDPDAFGKAIAFRKKLETVLPNIVVIKSAADPKDMDPEDIVKALKEVLPK